MRIGKIAISEILIVFQIEKIVKFCLIFKLQYSWKLLIFQFGKFQKLSD